MINENILEMYSLNIENYDIDQVELGHINKSYRLIDKSNQGENYFLQKINPTPFTSVHEVMENIETILVYLSKSKLHNSTYLKIIHTKNNSTYFTDSQGQYWRLFENLNEYEIIKPQDTLDKIKLMGTAYANFIKQLEAIPTSHIHITIPDFHNIKMRYLSLQKSIHNNPVERLKRISSELEKIENLYPDCLIIQDLIDSGEIPTRITHNDTKASNIMINSNTNSTCVIDLDTVMPSSLLFDYGDSIRSIISDIPEDSLESHQLKLKNKDAFHSGFHNTLQDTMTAKEIELLDISCVYMPLIMGIRFLTDFINGDQYFGINYPDHNLNRAKNQIDLALEIHSQLKRRGS